MAETVVVSHLSQVCEQGKLYRISAMVGDDLLWFESADAELLPCAEGYASALLVPAMSLGKNLQFEDPLCHTWLLNSRKLIEIFSGWWGWPSITISSSSEKATARQDRSSLCLCFSGGVDSFYSLLTYPQPIDKLVMVHGYDIDVHDHEGARQARQHMMQVAAEKGLEAVMVKTNYRAHPFAGRRYKYAYGGALAAIGHLLGGTGELIISSGYRYDEAGPDGSYWQNDPLWSSEFMKVIHYGADHIRDHKLRKIANDPSLRKHLRVCQENLHTDFIITAKAINCGRCLKCLRTLLVMRQEGTIDDLEIFENRKQLDLNLYNHHSVGEFLFKAYEEIIARGVDKSHELAIRALLRRSRVLQKFAWSGRKGRLLVFVVLRFFDLLERKLIL